jgi:formyl-CoA transferase/CoA:oxalate CoA-transferase
MTSALGGITVLDLSHALAGPFATTLLADYGADVIKIEPPGSGDIARAWGPPFYGTESSYFLSLNRNKRSIEIDLKHAEGTALFFKLLRHADVVIENLRIGTVKKLGIDYDAVRHHNPRVVYCSISGFGQDGPYRERAALDLIVQAESGMISVTGEAGGRGVRGGVSIADITAGMYAAFGIVTALMARERTGEGQFLDVSMLEGQLGILHGAIGSYLADGVVPKPMGTAYMALVPYQTFRTTTRDLALGAGSDKLWRSVCDVLGLTHLADDPRFATNGARVGNRGALIEEMQRVFLTKSYEEWEALLTKAGVPVGAINTVADVVSHPQVTARHALAEVDHPTAGRMKVVAPPVRMSGTAPVVRTPAPLLGQHTDEVLIERLGLDANELARLRAAGAIG